MSLPSIHLPQNRNSRPEQPLPVPGLGLQRGRVHEICGPARWSLAALILQLSHGPVLWISPGWQAERLYPPGLTAFADPARLLFARAKRPEDLLWSMEEALRSGAVPLVVAELMSPPALTPVRRLHLAAEAGAEQAHHHGRIMPLGLILTPEMGGAQGVESRWHMAALPTESLLAGAGIDSPYAAWTLQRLRARMAPPATWTLRQGQTNPTAG